MDVNSLVQTVAIYALPVLFAITLHEAAHGYVARHFGDMTAHAQGRISLNPIRHIDLVIDAGSCGTEPSTVIDLTEDSPVVSRVGKGSLEPFAVERV